MRLLVNYVLRLAIMLVSAVEMAQLVEKVRVVKPVDDIKKVSVMQPLDVVEPVGVVEAVLQVGTDNQECATSHRAAEMPVWTWECADKKHCVKLPVTQEVKACDTATGKCTTSTLVRAATSLNICRLSCDPHGVLWPQPSGATSIGHILHQVNPCSITVEASLPSSKSNSAKQTRELVHQAGKLFVDGLSRQGGVKGRSPASGGRSLFVTLRLHDPEITMLTQNTDESYHLSVSETKDGKLNATVLAANFFGSRHGLETLSQLIVLDDFTGALVVPVDVDLSDAPAFPYRGILLDTARNFISVEAIKRTLDGMAASKLNTFHWHITDTQSFPFQSQSCPLLTKYGAYSPQQIYTEAEIRDLVEYGRVRGVRIVPEFDAPAHVGEGWQWAGPDVIVCFNQEPWHQYCAEPPCGQLNPTSDRVFDILEGIYADMNNVFDSDLFHMGGDEVNFNCWNTSQVVVDAMNRTNLGRSTDDFLEVWSRFQTRALERLEKVSGKRRPVVLWTSTLTERGLVDKFLDNTKYIVQIWTLGSDSVTAELINKGFSVIYSNYEALYFDCGFGAWIGEGNNWCSPYIGWQKVYQNDPLALLRAQGVNVTVAQRALVLGQEAALWTEEVADQSVDGRLWPRAAAMAERVWTDPQTSWQEAEQRMLYHRERLVHRGIAAEMLEPEWCLQNPGHCNAD